MLSVPRTWPVQRRSLSSSCFNTGGRSAAKQQQHGTHGNRCSVYSSRNRLVQVSNAGVSTTYAHNGFGERVCKAIDSSQACASSTDRIEYVYDDSGHLIGEYPVGGSTAQAVEYVWLDDTPIAVLQRRVGSSDGGPTGGGNATAWNGTAAGGVDVYYLHPDHLDTPRVVVNAQNQAIWRWDSSPFGDTLADEQPTGGLPSYSQNLRFPGQQYDREAGSHYNYFRDYEAGTGRYLQSDPIGVDGGLGTFTYVGSEPFSFSDVFGLARKPAKKPESDENCPPKILRDGDGATPAEMAASTVGGGSRAGQSRRRRELVEDAQENSGGVFTCWRCGMTSTNPDDMHLGHRNAPTSKGGNLAPVNVCLEGAACNLSAGNRGGPSPGMSCLERGSCGAPYGR